jgi:hypothetical protein
MDVQKFPMLYQAQALGARLYKYVAAPLNDALLAP